MPLLDSLTDFRQLTTETTQFISYAHQVDAHGVLIHAQPLRSFITESAFLKIFIAWETLLESAVVKYMLGELSISGNNIPRCVTPLDEAHAQRILIGSQRYVDWSSPEIVRKLSNNFFLPGNPIDNVLSSIYQPLLDLKTIRNAAAHLSTTTQQSLDSLGSRLLATNSSNLRVSDLLLSIDPLSPTGDTIFTTNLNLLDVAAESICNG